jgi:hypothetical protein
VIAGPALLLLVIPWWAQSEPQRPTRPVLGGDETFLIVERGPNNLPLAIPRDEQLDYDVIVDAKILGNIDAGDVTLASGVEALPAGLPPASDPARRVVRMESGWIQSHARGKHMGYTLDHELKSRLLSQQWPSIFYTDTQSGSENRRREMKLGFLNGEFTAWMRSDGHCRGCDSQDHFIESNWPWGDPYHCKKCKRAEHRVWRDATQRAIPADSVDMLSAVYLARSLIREGLDEAHFPLVDRQRVWSVELRRGITRRIEVPAGKFDCAKVELNTSVMAGTPEEEVSGEKFQGMFGIQGQLSIWLETKSGVPVLIQGELPVPVVGELDVSVQLKKYRGTTPGFQPR